jgi:hypothetical protein
LSHYVSEAGAKGLEDFNIGPESANLTKNAARHVRIVLEKEFANPDYYDIAVPMHDKKQVVRTHTMVSCRLPHECIMDDHIADDERAAEFEKDHPGFFFDRVGTRQIGERLFEVVHYSGVVVLGWGPLQQKRRLRWALLRKLNEQTQIPYCSSSHGS